MRGLLVSIALVIIGCTEGEVKKEDILYPGAPVVSIKQTDFNSDAGYLKYRLEVQKPLSYDIEVKLELTRELGKGLDFRVGVPQFLLIPMQMGRTVEENRVSVHKGSLTLSILRWEGLGGSPYNVGSPHALTVKR